MRVLVRVRVCVRVCVLSPICLASLQELKAAVSVKVTGAIATPYAGPDVGPMVPGYIPVLISLRQHQ